MGDDAIAWRTEGKRTLRDCFLTAFLALTIRGNGE